MANRPPASDGLADHENRRPMNPTCGQSASSGRAPREVAQRYQKKIRKMATDTATRGVNRNLGGILMRLRKKAHHLGPNRIAFVGIHESEYRMASTQHDEDKPTDCILPLQPSCHGSPIHASRARRRHCRAERLNGSQISSVNAALSMDRNWESGSGAVIRTGLCRNCDVSTDCRRWRGELPGYVQPPYRLAPLASLGHGDRDG